MSRATAARQPRPPLSAAYYYDGQGEAKGAAHADMAWKYMLDLQRVSS